MDKATDNPLEEAAASQLAQANLHRMRRQWDEAGRICLRVLYDAPDHWRAHALLGDVAAERGQPDEAIQWYCMALDIRPDAQSTREKLSVLVNTKRTELTKTLSGSLVEADAEPSIRSMGLLRTLANSGVGSFRLAAVFCVLVVVGVCAFAIPLHSNQSERQIIAPVFTPAGLNGARLSQGGTPVSAAVTTLAAVSSPIAAAPSNAAPASAESLTDSDEALLLNALQHDASLHALGILIGTCVIDPSSQTAILTITSPAAQSSDPQTAIVNCALATARSAFYQASPSVLHQCTVRFSAQENGVQTVLFQGRIQRAAVESSGTDPGAAASSGQPAQSLFSSIWWSPSFPPSQANQPSAAPASAPAGRLQNTNAALST